MADESFGDSIDDVECLITRHQEFVEGQMPVSLCSCSCSRVEPLYRGHSQ